MLATAVAAAMKQGLNKFPFYCGKRDHFYMADSWQFLWLAAALFCSLSLTSF
jgi:hypothetical protein